ncbi:beta strand repeat-containing protein [Nisaea nitritireducens]|uniref:beta strand repeat-containing protein n=1 Tax=Nisaea nitritireducens TaxID=568392 RepID=UPI0029BFABD3|nr:calcium-binding protein [Nisaea nitritireducens]
MAETIIGGNFDDTILGGEGDDNLRGRAGDDLLDGGAGNDRLRGETGNDTLVGGAGDDTLQGGDGDDLLIASDGNDDFHGGSGTDTLTAAEDSQGLTLSDFRRGDSIEVVDAKGGMISGTASDNRLDFTSSSVTASAIDGGAGHDTIRGSAAADTVRGDEGNDDLRGGEGGDLLEGGAGNDRLRGESGNDTLVGGVGDDTLQGGNGDDLLISSDGNDDFHGGSGTDTLTAAEDSQGLTLSDFRRGDSIEVVDAKGGVISGTATDNRLDFMSSSVTASAIDGGAGQDTIRGSAAADTIRGGDGDDDLRGGEGGDLLEGGVGNDQLRGESGNDTLIGGDGDDTLQGGDGDDLLIASAGNDDFHGGSGTDTLATVDSQGLTLSDFRRGDSIEVVDARGGLISGTSSDNRLDFSASSVTASAIDGGAGHDTIRGSAAADTIRGGEGNDDLRGGDGGDRLEGGAGNDRLRGEIGNDTLVGGDGDDTLQGGDGDDLLIASDGSNDIRGDAGADTLQLAGSYSEYVIEKTGNSRFTITDTIAGRDGTNAIRGIETFEFADVTLSAEELLDSASGATEGDDLLIGSADDDLIAALGGNDTVLGGAGNDTLNGDSGADILSGGEGADLLDGGDGADTLFSGAGDDTVNGGADDDRLVTDGSGSQAFDGGAGTDTFEVDFSLFSLPVDFVYDGNLATGYSGRLGDPVLSDSLVNIENVDVSSASVAARLTGDGADNALIGGAGNDTLDGGVGNDTLIGNSGSDLFVWRAGDGNDVVVQGAVDDGAEDGVRIDGSYYDANWYRDGDDLVISVADGPRYDPVPGAGEIRIVGQYSGSVDAIDYFEIDGAFNDFYTDPSAPNGGLSRYLTPDGPTGSNQAFYTEIIQGDDGANVLQGFGGYLDYLYGRGGDDQILGSDDSERMRGGTGDDTLSGGGGSDNLRGGEGNDVLDGGAGTDEVDYRFTDDFGNDGIGVTVDLRLQGTVQDVGDGEGFDLLTGFERLIGSFQSDELHGDDAANRVRGSYGDDLIFGHGGDDQLRGEDGNDTVFGGAGSDNLIGSAGSDSLVGGDGFDRVSYWGRTRNEFDIRQLAGGEFEVEDLGTGEIDRLSEVEAVSFDDAYLNLTPEVVDNGGGNFFVGGTIFDDTITGVTGAIQNFIDGREGNDSLVGGPEYDGLRGGAGNDTLVGGGNAGNHPQGYVDDAQYSGVRAGYDVMQNGDGTFTVTDIDISDGDEGTDLLIDIQGISFADAFINIQPRVTDNGDGDFSIGGTPFDDTITGVTGAIQNFIDGREGNDSLVGGPEYDGLRGGAGNDTLVGGGNAGNHPQGYVDDAQYSGVQAGYDVMQNGDGTFTVTDIDISDGDEGTDLLIDIQGISFADAFINTQPRVTDNGGGDFFIGGTPFDDTITGVTGAIRTSIDGREGNDSLVGGAESDGLRGGAGNDTLIGGGNAGNHPQGFLDDAQYSGVQAGYDVTQIGDGSFTVTDIDLNDGDEGTDLLIDIEAIGFADAFINIQPTVFENAPGDLFVNGTPFDDTLTVPEGAFQTGFDGGEGNDSIIGSEKVENFNGGAGDDTFIGGGNDGTHPQGHLDTANYQGVMADYLISKISDDTFTVTDLNLGNGDDGTDTLVNVQSIGFADAFINLQPSVFENAPGDLFVNGTPFDDTLTVPAGAFQTGFNGGEGNDSITGSAKVENFNGEPGDDTFIGGGNDGTHPQGYLDAVNYQGVMADYEITQVNANTYTVTDLNLANGDDGTDTLIDLQGIGFADNFLLL